jgi:integrase
MTIMPRTTHRLNDKQVVAAGEGLHPDGGNLYLQVTLAADGKTKRRSWILRYTLADRQRYMGLGAERDGVGLAEARAAAEVARALLRKGTDPIEARDAENAKARAEIEAQTAAAAAKTTFRQVFEPYFEKRARTLTNGKHVWQWRATVEKYAAAFLDKPVADVRPSEIVTALEPIWHTKPETARRTLERLRLVFDSAILHEFRKTANPCTGVAKELGNNRPKVKGHHRALPHKLVPTFIARLRVSNSWPATKAAFEFLILAAARSGEVRHATWSEIDEAAALWTIPASHMKANKAHVVPLSPRCLEILKTLRGFYPSSPTSLLFPSPKGNVPISDMTMVKVMRDLGFADQGVPHGFRSSFRDWATEIAKAREVVAEACLAHGSPDATEAAYRRATYLDTGERGELMNAWAKHCCTPALTEVSSQRSAS